MNVGEIMATDFVRLNSEAKVTSLISALTRAGSQGAIIEDRGYLGTITKGMLFQTRQDLSKMKVSKILNSNPGIPVVSRDTPVEKAAELMYGADTRILPVLENGKVVGVVKAMDVISQAKGFDSISSVKAGDVATLRLLSVKSDSTLAQALALMEHHSIGKIPVVDEEHNIVGIVTQRDVMEQYFASPVYREGGFRPGKDIRHQKAFEPQKIDMLKSPITSEMTTNVITASKNDTIGRVVGLMEKHSIGDVVIAANKKPEGIITIHDILSLFFRAQEKRNIQLIHFPELDEVDYATAEKEISSAYDKIEKILNNEIFLAIHVKSIEKGGMRKKYSLHIRLNSTGINVLVKSENKWTFLSALQDALKTLTRQISEKVKR